MCLHTHEKDVGVNRSGIGRDVWFKFTCSSRIMQILCCFETIRSCSFLFLHMYICINRCVWGGVYIVLLGYSVS